jgi:hypothetical protein
MQYGRFGEQLKVAKICRGGATGFAQLRVIILTAPPGNMDEEKGDDDEETFFTRPEIDVLLDQLIRSKDSSWWQISS